MKVPGGWLALRRSLAIRDYRLFTLGNLMSNIGLWAQRVALGWLTWELTHSTAWLGAIAVAESVPTFVLGLVAGSIVDRANYLKLLRVTQALSLVYSLVMTGLVLVVVAFLVKPLPDLLPGFVGQVFAMGPGGLAALMSANGVGAMIAASWLASRGGGITGLTRVNLFGSVLRFPVPPRWDSPWCRSSGWPWF